MGRRRKVPSDAKPEAAAKRVRREDRSDFVAASFASKLKEMRAIMKGWRSGGRPAEAFWPDTKVALREWHDPEKCIFRWGSPNMDSPGGPNRDMVEEWDRLLEEASGIPIGVTDLKAENDQLKKINRKLGEQLATRTFQVMELLDAVATLDGSHHLLSTYSLRT
ncbi:hypothetical protein HLH89_33035 [Rhizobium laguerreae]|uniref:hypothetical protein n=1 Tax=Rhizobium laguerreae TaxID=1076926 RepID=UPI0014790F6A|nr:hypothetical protein [Rhizobium laguerreae]NNH85778.1 hypothetical protein [Rhizobium laguerreae]